MSHLVGTNSETWTRFHVLNFEEEDNGAPRPNNMTTWTELHFKLRDDFTCTRRRDGSILVDAKTKENAEQLSNISQLGDNNVTTSRDLRMNATRATVLVHEWEFNHASEIESCLLKQCQAQGLPVSSVKHFTRKSRKSKATLHLASLTFESRILPEYIYVGFEKVRVREDLPRSRQCQNCCKFGHPAEFCRSSLCCPICGIVGHDKETCRWEGDRSFKGRCPNCSEEGHTAFSKQCALYRRELEALLIIRRQGISKRAAFRVLEENNSFPNVSYARRTSGRSSQHQPQQQQREEPQPQQQRQEAQQQEEGKDQEEQQQSVEDQMKEIFEGITSDTPHQHCHA